MRTSNRSVAGWGALGLFLVLLGLGVCVVLQVPKEPALGGQPLTQYLRSIRPPSPGSTDPEGMKQTLLQMAPECFPYMLAMMRDTDSRLRYWIDALLAKQTVLTFRVSPRPSYRTRWEAARGFAVLGQDAQPAVPGLARLLRDPDTASQAAFALAHIGTDDARHALEDALRSKHTEIRQTVIAQLDGQGSHAGKLVAALIERLGDPDGWVRENAARALGTIRSSPDRAVPALAAALRDRSTNVRRVAARALREFGEDARPAEPGLRAALLENDPTYRSAVEQALFTLGTNY